ncbi:MAG: DUF5665 domain-containing protein [Clostridia bacterium]
MGKRNDEKKLNRIESLLLKLSQTFDKAKIYDYIEVMSSTRKLLKRSFLAGIMRGLGAAIGFSVLGAILIIILRSLTESSIPFIAEFIKKIVDIVDK